MIQKGLTVGLLEVNCYILGDEETKEAVVIDPGGDEDEILEVLNHHKLQLKLIIDTHGHFDHVDANQPLKEATGAKIAIHEADAQMLDKPSAEAMFFTGNRLRLSQPDILLKENDILTFGAYRLEGPPYPGTYPGRHQPAFGRPPLRLRGRHPLCRVHRPHRLSRRGLRRPDQRRENQNISPGR